MASTNRRQQWLCQPRHRPRHGAVCRQMPRGCGSTRWAATVTRTRARSWSRLIAAAQNGPRLRLWKVELQRLSDETGLTFQVCIILLVPRSGTKSSTACSCTSARPGAQLANQPPRRRRAHRQYHHQDRLTFAANSTPHLSEGDRADGKKSCDPLFHAPPPRLSADFSQPVILSRRKHVRRHRLRHTSAAASHGNVASSNAAAICRGDVRRRPEP